VGGQGQGGLGQGPWWHCTVGVEASNRCGDTSTGIVEAGGAQKEGELKGKGAGVAWAHTEPGAHGAQNHFFVSGVWCHSSLPCPRAETTPLPLACTSGSG